MRRPISLAGNWQFQLDPNGTLDVESLAPDRQIPVPCPWQVAFPELQEYSGYAWYRTQIDVDVAWLGGELLLHFGAVDYWCQVFVNGERVFQHEGGYTPFTIPIKAYARPEEKTRGARKLNNLDRISRDSNLRSHIVNERTCNSVPRGRQKKLNHSLTATSAISPTPHKIPHSNLGTRH